MVKGNNQLALCVDEGSGLVSDSEGEPFFNQDQSPSRSVSEVLDFLQKTEKFRNITDRAVSELYAAGLVNDWPLKLTIGGREVEVPGLGRIDDAKLSTLDPETLNSLHKSQALLIAYGQLFSMGNVSLFSSLARFSTETPQPEPDKQTPDQDTSFLWQDDSFKF